MAVTTNARLSAVLLALLPAIAIAHNRSLAARNAPHGGSAGAVAGSGSWAHRRRLLGPSYDNKSSEKKPYDKKPYDTCVCVFDFDETLRVISKDGKDFDVPARDGAGIIRACQDNGWGIGIASANDNVAKLQKVLGQRVDNVTFTSSFFNTSAFQYHWYNKTVSLDSIARYYDTSPRCMMLFDDLEHNRKYAEALGVTFMHVRNDTGIRWYDYTEGQKYLFKNCYCAKPQDRTYSSFSYLPPDRNFAGRDRYGKPLASSPAPPPAKDRPAPPSSAPSAQSEEEEKEVPADQDPEVSMTLTQRDTAAASPASVRTGTSAAAAPAASPSTATAAAQQPAMLASPPSASAVATDMPATAFRQGPPAPAAVAGPFSQPGEPVAYALAATPGARPDDQIPALAAYQKVPLSLSAAPSRGSATGTALPVTDPTAGVSTFPAAAEQVLPLQTPAGFQNGAATPVAAWLPPDAPASAPLSSTLGSAAVSGLPAAAVAGAAVPSARTTAVAPGPPAAAPTGGTATLAITPSRQPVGQPGRIAVPAAAGVGPGVADGVGAGLGLAGQLPTAPADVAPTVFAQQGV